MTLSNFTVLIPLSGTNIDTSEIDGWRQGVEITLQKHFDAGTVKITSGEKGHKSAVLNYVQDRLNDFSHAGPFNDPTTSYPLALFSNHVEHTLVTNYEGVGSAFIGSLEPISLQKRFVTALDHDGFPLDEVYLVKSDTVIVSNIFEVNQKYHSQPNFDLENPKFKALKRRVLTSSASIAPYSEFIVFDVIRSSVTGAMGALEPETDSYLRYNQFSQPCGFVFDSCPTGTDSIAFGGKAY